MKKMIAGILDFFLYAIRNLEDQLSSVYLLYSLILLVVGCIYLLKGLLFFYLIMYLSAALPALAVLSSINGVGAAEQLIFSSIIGILAVFVYQIGIFVIGFLITSMLAISITGDGALAIFLGMIGGLIAIAINNIFIIFYTCLVGATLISVVIGNFLHAMTGSLLISGYLYVSSFSAQLLEYAIGDALTAEASDAPPIFILIFLALFAGGFYFQTAHKAVKMIDRHINQSKLEKKISWWLMSYELSHPKTYSFLTRRFPKLDYRYKPGQSIKQLKRDFVSGLKTLGGTGTGINSTEHSQAQHTRTDEGVSIQDFKNIYAKHKTVINLIAGIWVVAIFINLF